MNTAGFPRPCPGAPPWAAILFFAFRVRAKTKTCSRGEYRLSNKIILNKSQSLSIPSHHQITVKLDLKSNYIQELPSGSFKHTPYLTHLSLQRCNLRTVKEGAFRALGRLVFLNLANNNMEILYQVRDIRTVLYVTVSVV